MRLFMLIHAQEFKPVAAASKAEVDPVANLRGNSMTAFSIIQGRNGEGPAQLGGSSD